MARSSRIARLFSRQKLPRIVRANTFRLAALYLAIFIGSALLLGAAVFFQARAAFERQIDARIEVEMNFMRDEYHAGGFEGLLRSVEVRGKGVSALDYLLQDRSGRHLAGEIPAQTHLSPGWTNLFVPMTTEGDGRPEFTRALVADLGNGLVLAVGADLAEIDDLEQAIVSAFAWTVGPATLLGIAGGLMLSRAFLRQVDAIGRTAEAIIAGDLSRRIPSRNTGDDLDRLAGTLNRMLDRIALLMDSLRQVSSDVAHDLRTPLTRLYQRLEGARLRARSVADYEAAVDLALGDADALLGTFSALLRIAQVEGHASNVLVAPVDLAELAETVVDAYRPDAEASGHFLQTIAAAPAWMIGDRELLTQAVANLVENAMRHTPSGTQIDLSIGRSENRVHVIVQDNGPGVQEADLPMLTRRFFRTEQSRTSPGNGLGLALVNAVVTLHGGDMSLARGDPGLRARLSFSAKPARHVGKFQPLSRGSVR